MRWPAKVRLRLRTLLRRNAVESELDEELRFHLECSMAEPAAGLDSIKEACRDERGTRRIENFVQDLRYGFRLIVKAPGFSAAAVLTIAIGIAAATSIFSVVYGVVLQPLPYREPERLVSIWSRVPKFDMPRAYVGAANWRDWRAQSSTLEDIALVRHIANYNLTGDGEPERLMGARVTANLFRVLGVTPAIGRTFTEENERPSTATVALLSDGLWRRRFGGDPAIVGRSIRLNGIPYTVLGVMRPDFRYPSREFELWAPLPVQPEELQVRLSYNYLAVGRLKPGVTIAQTQSDLDTISARLAAAYKVNEGVSAGIAPLLDDTVRPVSTALYVLFGAVGCLLLIGTVNVANLLLARGLSRARERAVRAALGASRGRLIAQAVTEITPMVAAGAALGVLGAASGFRALIAMLPATTPRIDEIHMSLPVFGFSLILLVAISILVAFWPAMQTASARIAEPLQAAGRSNSRSRSHSRLRELLVVSEIALTVLLVAGAGLLFRSLVELRRVNTGFESSRALTMHLAITRTKYPEDRDVAALVYRVLEGVRALPGVVAAGMVNRLPIIGGTQSGAIEFEGDNLPVKQIGNTDWRTATPGYFQAMGIPLIAGRLLAESDTEGSKLVGLIDVGTASMVWPNQSPIGRHFRMAVVSAPWVEIVGVVGRIRHDGLDVESRTQVYWNYRQRMQDRMALVVRTAGDPSQWTSAVISRIRSVDPEQTVYNVFTMDDIVDQSLSQRRLNAFLVAVFASVSLLLAAIGIYGVVAYSVQQRVREFGIRLALGARRSEVVRMVVLRAAAIAGIGSALGLGAAGALARYLSSVLFQVSGTDRISYAAAAAVLIVVALLASYVPVRRALAMDPMQSLRIE
jgi:putative ABC transport system permease protein